MKINITVKDIPISVDSNCFDDFETLELLAELKNNDVTVFPALGKRIYGEEQLHNIVNTLRKDGVCKVSDMVPVIMKTIEKAAAKVNGGDSKN